MGIGSRNFYCRQCQIVRQKGGESLAAQTSGAAVLVIWSARFVHGNPAGSRNFTAL
jgi:hypothetical protein